MNNTAKSEKIVVGILKESLCLGGTERSAANISKLLEQSFGLHFIIFNGSDIKYTYGGNLIDIKAPPKKSLLGKFVNSFIRYLRVKKAMKHNKIDIIYEFITIENMLSYVSYKDTKRIISARDFGKIQRNTEGFHKALSKANAMICNSEYIKNYYLSKYPEHKDKVFTVYNVIDGDEIARQAVEEPEKGYLDFIKAHSKTISVVGRFCKEKGFEFMLEAFAKATEDIDLGLVMIGDGDYKERYTSVIERLGIKEKVYFTGFQNNPYKYMARSDIFVLSSLSEGFPNVLAEAMSMGLPVIAANCYSGPAEILRNDSDYQAVTDSFKPCDYGIITPRITENDNKNAVLELSKAIEYLARNEEIAKEYSLLSKKRAMAFSPDNASMELNKIFEILSKKG